MSFLDSLMSFLETSGLEHPSLPAVGPAVIAAGALVAFADGRADPNELRTIDQTALAALFNQPGVADDIRVVLDRHADNFDRGLDYGRVHALAVLADWTSATEAQKDMVLRAALQIGQAGSELSDVERDAVREIARTLDLNPARYGL